MAKNIVVSKGNFVEKASELHFLKEQMAVLESKAKPLRDAIKAFVMINGTKTYTGGFISDTGNLIVEAKSRRKIYFDAQKVEVTLINKPELLNQVLKTTVVVDDVLLNALYESGEITSQEMQNMATIESSHSLYVTKKESVPEIKQTQVKTAAVTKRKLTVKNK